MNFSIGDDDFFELSSWFASSILGELAPLTGELQIKSKFSCPKVHLGRKKQSYDYDVTHIISLKDDSFTIEIGNNPNAAYTFEDVLGTLRSLDFWFAIYATCSCNNSVNTLDIRANYITNKFENVGVEQEGIWLTNTEHPLHVSLHPLQNVMKVTRLVKDEDGSWLDNSDEIRLPIINVYDVDEKQLVDRIRTLMTFS